MFRIENLTKSFNEVTLFKDLNLSFDDLGVMVKGDIGTGKSTLFEILSGEDKNYSGEFTQFKPLEIGYLIQNNEPFFFHTIVEDELSETSNDGLFKVDELIKLFQFDSRSLKADPYSLPRSFRKILQLIITITQKRKLFLLDEPDSSLSLNNLKKVADLVSELGRNHPTFVISHSDMFSSLTNLHTLNLEGDGNWSFRRRGDGEV